MQFEGASTSHVYAGSLSGSVRYSLVVMVTATEGFVHRVVVSLLVVLRAVSLYYWSALGFL